MIQPAEQWEITDRVVVLVPLLRDNTLVSRVLNEIGVEAMPCSSLVDLIDQLFRGTGALLIAEEVLDERTQFALWDFLGHQPPWSDIPVLVLTRAGSESHAVSQAVARLGNVTLLERPIRIAALQSAVRSALRARQRQYQIRAHIAKLREAEDALRELDRRKDEFLATLSHELRNPLAPLNNSLHILKLRNRDDEPLISKATEIMERQVNHLERLVDDLLEVSRITRGKIELRMERVVLCDLVAAAIESTRTLADAAGHTLVTHFVDKPIILDADPVRLTQVFTNLLNNAVKYSATGSTITATVFRDGNTAVVKVRDTGMGITPEMLPRVFDMFAQADRSLRQSQGGLGIGLTLVQRLVQLHGGTVRAHSEGLGQGSEFTVLIPIANHGVASAESNQVQPDEKDLAGVRALIVDDNDDAAESTAIVLSALGAEVSVAHNGPEALSKIEDFRPAAVLLDIGMPGMDGYAIARRIRLMPSVSGVTIVAITGWGQADDRARSHQAGFDHHLTKPVNLAVLSTILRSAQTGKPISPSGVTPAR